MKKIFLLIFLLSPFVYASSANYCILESEYPTGAQFSSKVSNSCEDNNILVVKLTGSLAERASTAEIFKEYIIYNYCRFDREIIIFPQRVVCQLRSTKSRNNLPQKKKELGID